MKSINIFDLRESNNPLCILNTCFLWDPESYCVALNNYIDNNELGCNNAVIARMVNRFADKYSLAKTIKQSISFQLLDDDNTHVIIYPYQPNAFPSVSVIAPFVHMEHIKNIMEQRYEKKIVPVFLIVDYDSLSDRRFQGSYIPSLLEKDCKISLRHKMTLNKQDTMFSAPLPERGKAQKWFSMILDEARYLDAFLDAKGNIIDKSQTIVSDLSHAFQLSNTFSEFNVRILFKIVTKYFNLSTLFIEGHDNYIIDRGECCNVVKQIELNNQKMIKAYEMFVDQYSVYCSDFSIRKDTVESGLWKYCFRCKKRCSIGDTCDEICNPEYVFPNVIYDYLIDYLFYKKVGGIGYYKQAEATIFTDYLLQKVFNISPCPQFLSKVALDVTEFIPKINEQNYEQYIRMCNDSHCCILFYLMISSPEIIINKII